MKRTKIYAMFLLAIACAGCAAFAPKPADSLLARADARMAAEDYGAAATLYGEFVEAAPAHAQAARARAMRTALGRLLASQGELERRTRTDEAPRLRRELTDRQSDLERLKAEMAKLRTDLERLRSIDLQELRPENKK